MEKVTLSIVIFITIPETMLVASLGLSILGIKIDIKKLLIIGIVQSIFTYLVHSFEIIFDYITVLKVIFFSLNMYFTLLIPYTYSFIAILAGLTLYIGIESISAPLLLYLTGLQLYQVLNSFWLRIAFFTPEALAMFSLQVFVRRKNIKLPGNLLQKNNNINKYIPLLIMFSVQTLLLTILYISNLIDENRMLDTNLIPHIFLVLIFTLLPFLAFNTIRRIIRLIEEETESKAEIEKLRQLQNLLDAIHEQRHNFSHELQVTYGLLEVEAFQEAKAYIRESMEEIAVTSELIRVDNLNITALLQTKFSLAQSKKIKLSIIVKTSLKSLSIKDRDFNIILGNLIDNAIEAVEKLPIDKKINIIFTQSYEGCALIVENNGVFLDDSLKEKIFEKGFSTKGEDRGIGLYSVKKILNECNAKISVNTDRETKFTQFIVSVPYKE